MNDEKELQISRDFAFVFTGEEGEKVLAKLARFCHIEEEVFAADNARLTDFRLGQRSVYLEISRQIKKGRM